MNLKRYRSRLKKLPFCRKNPFRQTGEDGEAGEGPQCGTNVFASGGVHIQGRRQKNVCSAAKSTILKIDPAKAGFKYKMEVEFHEKKVDQKSVGPGPRRCDALRHADSLRHLWTGVEAGYLDDAVAAYNAQSDKYYVEALSVPDSQKIMVAIQSGDGPDITDDFTNNIGAYASKGIMLPLDDYIAKNNTDLSDIIPSTLEACKYEGKTYALPAGMNLMALFYNKTLLAEAGYTEPPKTMEEMYEMAVNTTKLNPDGTIDVMGYPDFPSVYYTDNFAAALGGGWYDENGKPASPDNEGNLMALKYAVMYREKFGVENVAKFGSAGKYLDPTDPFLAGKQTFRVDGNWLGANINDTFKVDVDYGCTFIPYPEGHEELKGRGIASSSMFYIPSNSKNPDGAYDFLTFICGPEGTMLQSVSHGGFPSLLSQLESDEFVNGSYNSDVFAELAASPNLFALPNVPQSTEYNTIIKEEVELALNLKQTPEQALQNIYDKGSELFK